MTQDRNLLLGILALQNDFITRNQLVDAMNAWAVAKHRSLGEVLRERGALGAQELGLLEALLACHVARHGGDAERSLHALAAAPAARAALADADLQASLGHASFGPTGEHSSNVFATRAASTIDYPNTGACRYRPLRPHARGGLGEVFVAEDTELHREVALKEIQARHADDPGSRGRFLLEGEITGRLEHPGIVPVYGLGTYGDGRPFYAMRFIKGDNLKQAIAQFHQRAEAGPAAASPRRGGAAFASLEFRQLLRRFVDVCNAIGYAHSRGVLHRDLKPGNVMLGEFGETLVVDWGLAKVVGRAEVTAPEQAPATEPTLRPALSGSYAETMAGTAVGTPAYMSPEQAAGRLDELGPATDIYSLGATLYSVLTGVAPVEGQSNAADVLEKVRRGDIPAADAVRPGVPKPLAAICRQAMAVRAEDRYATAGALADDVEHWLADEPVTAWREPWRMRAGRWLRRHRSVVAASVAALVVVALSLGVLSGVLSAANERERDAKDQAQANFLLARETVDEYCFKVSQNVRLKSADLRDLRRDLLQAAVKFYDACKDQPGDSLDVQRERRRAYQHLGKLTFEIAPEQAVGPLATACDLGTSIAAATGAQDDQHELAISFNNLGRTHLEAARLREAEEYLLRALTLREELVAAQPGLLIYQETLATVCTNLGVHCSITGQFQRAEELQLRALAIRRDIVRDDRPAAQLDVSDNYNNLGVVYRRSSRPKEALEAFQQALAIRKQLVAEHPQDADYRSRLAVAHSNLGMQFQRSGDLEAADEHLTKAVEHCEALLKEHASVTQFQSGLADSLNNLAGLQRIRKRLPAAQALYDRSRDIRARLADAWPTNSSFRAEHAASLNNLGVLHQAKRSWPEAETHHRKALTIRRDLLRLQPDDPGARAAVAASLTNLGNTLVDSGAPAGAEDCFQEALTLKRALAQEQPRNMEVVEDRARGLLDLGRFLRFQHRPEAAVAHLIEAERTLSQVLAAEPKNADAKENRQKVLYQTAETFTTLTRYGEALAAWDRLLATYPPAEIGIAELRLRRARVLALLGRHQDAITVVKGLPLFAFFDPDLQYSSATVYAIAAVAVANDSTLSAEERPRLVDEHAANAVKHLVRLKKAGYFKTPGSSKRVAQESDFAELRRRPDFIALAKEIGAMP